MFTVPIGSPLPVTLPAYLNYIPTTITAPLMMVAAAQPSKAQFHVVPSSVNYHKSSKSAMSRSLQFAFHFLINVNIT
jgi:hypothetical protein